MPPIYLANCVQILVKQHQATRPIVNVLHAQATASPFTVTDLTSMAVAVQAAWQTGILALQTDGLVLESVECTDLVGPTGATGISVSGATGGAGGSVQSLAVAACVSLHTARRYRGGHGRTYLAGITDDMVVSATHFFQDAADDFKEGMDTLNTTLTGATFGAMHVAGLSILHGRTQSLPHVTPPVFLPPFQDLVTTISCNTRLDSQRRRLGRT